MQSQVRSSKAAAIQEPSIPLNELFKLFARSASDPELEDAYKALASRLCVLTRHVQVLAARLVLLSLKNETAEKQLAELDQHLAGFIETLGPIVQDNAGGEATAQDPQANNEPTEPQPASDETIAATARQSAKERPAPGPRPARAGQPKANDRAERAT